MEIVLDDSYLDAWGDWDPRMRAEIADVLKEIEANPLFRPDVNVFLYEHKPSEQICACQKIGSWGKWQLAWWYEVDTRLLLQCITQVLVMARQNSLRLIEPDEGLSHGLL